MHVSNQKSPFTRHYALPIDAISLISGFWQEKQELIGNTSLHTAYKKLIEHGNFNNLQLVIGTGEGQFRGPQFMDSDIYKWLEATGYYLNTHTDEEISRMANEAISLMEKVQQPDGITALLYVLD